jgi:hypothetical protein
MTSYKQDDHSMVKRTKEQVESIMQRAHIWVNDAQLKADTEKDTLERESILSDISHLKSNFLYWSHQLEQGVDICFCTSCGKLRGLPGKDNCRAEIIEGVVCSTCIHWAEVEQKHISGKEKYIITRGLTFEDNGNDLSSRHKEWLGFYGKVWDIIPKDGSASWQTNNLWRGRVIPLKYRKTTMKDTHVIVGMTMGEEQEE